MAFRYNSNARSIKTRIETRLQVWLLIGNFIRMQDPLKQGLKPYYSVLDFDFFF